MIELHGGTISAQSLGKEQGATFTVELPLVEQTQSHRQQASVEAPSLEGVRLLVVDDDVDNLEITSFWLEQHGAKVTAVDQPQKALDCLATEVPDGIISDISMPEINGYELIRQIRAKFLHQVGSLPAIALTAHASETDRQNILAAGFNCHLTKPIKPFQLVAHVAHLLQESRQ